jgi:filamentous hemagglutinin family protein
MCLGLLAGAAALPASGVGGIVADDTAGTSVVRAGPRFEITEGTRRGRNLFHSFSRFDLDRGATADFVDTTGGGVAHVIGRVTGGAGSRIDGLIRSDIPGADLFLLNPEGIVFGPGASLEVQGSFHAAAADELRLADGTVFSARPAQRGSFSAAAPRAFGFLGRSPAGIVVDGAVLEVAAGKRLMLVGGSVDITGAALRSDSGAVDLVGAGGETEVARNASAAKLAAAGATGNVRLSEFTSVDTSGAGGGVIRIVGGTVTLDRTGLLSINDGGGGGGVSIRARGDVSLTGGTLAAAFSQGPGRAGDLRISAGGDIVLDDSLLATDSFDEGDGGDGGDIRLEATNARIQASFLQTESDGPGDSGDVSLTLTKALFLTGASEIAAGTNGVGAGGAVRISAGDVEILEGSQVRANGSATEGPGGNVDIQVRGTLRIAGSQTLLSGERQFSTISAQTDGTADAGDVVVAAAEVLLRDGGRITTQARSGDGGNVDLKVAFQLSLDDSRITTSVRSGDGGGGNITIDPVFVILVDSLIEANAFGGPGGNIRIVTDNFIANPGSAVTASSDRNIDGEIEINAPDTNLGESLVVLPSAFVDPASRLAQKCAARRGRTAGRFVGRGRGGIPGTPDDPLHGSFAPAGEPGSARARDAGPGRAPESARATGLLAGTLVLECVD